MVRPQVNIEFDTWGPGNKEKQPDMLGSVEPSHKKNPATDHGFTNGRGLLKRGVSNITYYLAHGVNTTWN